MQRFVREPLVHFLLLALLVFGAYGLVSRREPATATIDVTQAKIEQLAGLFAKTWQRPPTAQELKGLIDDYVKEDIYVREALRLGLDTDDEVIRKRLRMKMEFVSDAEAEAGLAESLVFGQAAATPPMSVPEGTPVATDSALP